MNLSSLLSFSLSALSPWFLSVSWRTCSSSCEMRSIFRCLHFVAALRFLARFRSSFCSPSTVVSLSTGSSETWEAAGAVASTEAPYTSETLVWTNIRYYLYHQVETSHPVGKTLIGQFWNLSEIFIGFAFRTDGTKKILLKSILM